MKMNVGMVDKIARIIVGVVLIALAYTDRIGVWGYIGIIPLVTGLMGWCPLYTLLKMSTNKSTPA